MFRKILDVTHVDLRNPLTVDELELNLRRLERLDHSSRPKSANTCRITPRRDLYNKSDSTSFLFEVQYGVRHWQTFIPIGAAISYSTESLPYL